MRHRCSTYVSCIDNDKPDFFKTAACICGWAGRGLSGNAIIQSQKRDTHPRGCDQPHGCQNHGRHHFVAPMENDRGGSRRTIRRRGGIGFVRVAHVAEVRAEDHSYRYGLLLRSRRNARKSRSSQPTDRCRRRGKTGCGHHVQLRSEEIRSSISDARISSAGALPAIDFSSGAI